MNKSRRVSASIKILFVILNAICLSQMEIVINGNVVIEQINNNENSNGQAMTIPAPVVSTITTTATTTTTTTTTTNQQVIIYLFNK